MDELEGTLRGHIGIIEGALDRLEGKVEKGDPAAAKKIEDLYMARGRDQKGKRQRDTNYNAPPHIMPVIIT